MTMLETELLGAGPDGTYSLAVEEYEDYFGFDAEKRYVFPDKKQYIVFRAMNEGQRRKYEERTSRSVSFNRKTDDAKIKINAGEDRHELIMESVTGWHLVRKVGDNWEPVPFSKGSEHSELAKWLKVADPRIVNDLHAAIVRANPWLSADMTVEMIDEEMERLKGLRQELVERDAVQKNS